MAVLACGPPALTDDARQAAYPAVGDSASDMGYCEGPFGWWSGEVRPTFSGTDIRKANTFIWIYKAQSSRPCNLTFQR